MDMRLSLPIPEIADFRSTYGIRATDKPAPAEPAPALLVVMKPREGVIVSGDEPVATQYQADPP
jgi:hypothetical protein